MTIPSSGSQADELVDQAVRVLRDAAAAHGSAGLSLFVDPMLGDSVAAHPAIRDALARGLLQRKVLPRIHADIAPDETPYLLCTSNEELAERAITASIDFAIRQALAAPSPLNSSRTVCGWIIGRSDVFRLADDLSNVARVRRPDGSSWPLRYWDPRVMWHLSRVLAAEQWSSMQSALAGWHTLTMTHQMEMCALPIKERVAPPIAELRFDVAAWSRLERIGPTNMVLGMASEWGVPPLVEHAVRVERFLEACFELGFRTTRDGQVFAACGLTTHDEFYTHPEVATALKRASDTGRSVKEALAPFTDAFWDSLSAEALRTQGVRRVERG